MAAESPQDGGCVFCGLGRRTTEAEHNPTKNQPTDEDLQRTARNGAIKNRLLNWINGDIICEFAVDLFTQLHKIFIKQRNGFNAFEVIEDSEMFVGRMDGIRI